MSSAVRHRLVRGGLLSAVVGVLACVAVAAPVLAFTSRSTHRTIVPAVPTVGQGWGTFRVTYGSSTATCPEGRHVLFGGFGNVATGARRTADNRWTVDGFNIFVHLENVSNAPRSLYSMAYCGNGPVPSKATSTVEIRYRKGRVSSGSATARCPAGTVVVAGGFATTPHSAVFVTDLERVASDLWRVSAYLVPNISPQTALTSIAYCGPGPAPKLVSQAVTSFNHAGYLGLARATCPAPTHLIFGGAILKSTANEFLQTLRVPVNTKNTWAVTGYGGMGRGKLTALAYCR